MVRSDTTPTRGESWWYAQHPDVRSAPLHGNVVCDTVVVGGGIAGLHTALRLCDAGQKVVVLEATRCGGGMTGRSSGFLTPDSELQLKQLIGRYGAEDARLLWGFAKEGADLVAANAQEYALSCDLQRVDCLYVGVDGSGAKVIVDEVLARRQLGLVETPLDAFDVDAVLPGDYTAGLTYGDTWAIDGFGYCQGLRQVLLEKGVVIYEGTPAMSLEGTHVATQHGSVFGGHVVMGLNRMPRAVNPRASSQIYHAQTVLAVSELLTAAQIRALFPQQRYQVWDTTDNYTYYRLTGDHRLLLGGGTVPITFARHSARRDVAIRSVIDGFVARFPALAELKFVRWWPGFIDVTRDLMPTIATDPENLQVHYILGCPGIPWASWAGNHTAARILDPQTDPYTRFFAWDRPGSVPRVARPFLSKPVSFALDILAARRAGSES